MQPTTRFARSGEASIAFQVVGAGPDVVFVPGFCSHLDLMWGDPAYARFIRRVAEFCRLTIYDRRSTGLSDRFDRPTSLDEGVADLGAVIAAVEARQPTILGFSEGGAIATAYAAAHPDRVRSLVLCETFLRGRPGPGYLEDRAAELDALTRRVFELADRWGEGRMVEFFGPSMVGGRVHRRLVGIFERAAASPQTIRHAFTNALELDARSVLPAVAVPTLVLHRRDDIIPIEAGRYVADQIPGARFVELSGGDHMPWAGDYNAVAVELERFLSTEHQVRDTDRSWAALAFVALVDGAGLAAELGDAGFGQLMETFRSRLRDLLTSLAGREVKPTEDGVLASFDGSAAAMRFGLAAVAAARRLGYDASAGIHAGEVRSIAGDLGGIAVHAAARVTKVAAAGEVVATQTARDLASGAGLDFASLGHHELRGLPGPWELFAVAAASLGGPARIDPLAGMSRGERALLQSSGRSYATSRVLSRVLHALP